jgi:hypothetical protein
MIKRVLFMTFIVILCGPTLLFADYIIVLKNGRQLTVPNYREEGAMIKFTGFGGEIGIDKSQVQTIRKADPGESSGLNVGNIERARPLRSTETRPESSVPEEASSTPAERAREEQAYQQNLSELSQRLKEVRDRYSEAIRETTSSEPSQLVTEDQRKARQDDVISRFKDAQSNPSDPAPVKLLEPSPFSSLPPTITEVRPAGRTVSPYDSPPVFTEQQQQLLDLRNQALQLEKERENLINEMKRKNFNSVQILE